MILTGRYNHQALIKCGATFVRNEPDGNTYVEPDGLDMSNYGAFVLSVHRESKIAETKAEAQRRIYAIVPQWKQANLTARLGELHDKRLNGVALTSAEQNEVTAGFALWDKAKAIRAASDLIEADIKASTDPANFNVTGSPRWPV